MSDVLMLDRDQTRAALDPARVTDAVRRALIAISAGTASVPPRIAARTAHGLLGAMPGYVPDLGLAAKLITVFDDPDHPGRSSHRGLVALFDEHDGRLLALLDAEPLTAVRTAAAATLAARALARPGARRIAVIGTGTQASAQLTLLAGGLGEVLVVGRDAARTRELAARHGVGAAASIESAVRAADVVFCCTGAREPVLRRAWLRPGTHIGSVGGSQGPELDADTVREAAIFAEWTGAATEPPPAGAHELQGLAPGRVVLLGAVLAGTHPGRRDERGMTVFKSTGHAALDVAAAVAVHRRAVELGLGTSLPF